MSTANTYRMSLRFSQVLELVRQLPVREKVKLGEEISKEFIDRKWSRFLRIFKNGGISLAEISEETEKVRDELHAKSK